MGYKNLEDKRAYENKWRAENRDKVRGYQKAWYAKNPSIWRRYHFTTKGYYTKLCAGAKRRGSDFLLGRSEFVDWFESQELKCHYCDRELSRGSHNGENVTIDRKDNNRGYQIDNIVFSCRRCNMIKGNTFSEDEMIEIADRFIKPKLRDGVL